MIGVYDLLLDKRHGGVSAPEGEGTDLEEGKKELKADHPLALLSRRSVRITPKTAQTRMMKITFNRKK